MSRNLLIPLLLLVGVASVGGSAHALFFGPNPWKDCDIDERCGPSEICVNGRCTDGCRTTSQCRARGLWCVENRCREIGPCNVGERQRCYHGPRQTEGVGACRGGFKYCLANRTWSPCEGQLLPRRETCDGQDNDCNGRVDDGLECQCRPGSARRCYTGPSRTLNVGECKAGVQYCQMDSRWGSCLGQALPRPEVCDGKDNDCDGRIDQGSISCQCKPGAVRSCYSHNPRTAGVGECRRGKQVCLTSSRWSAECFEQRGPAAEVCDGKDNNCNGAVDEGCLVGATNRRLSIGEVSRVGLLGRPSFQVLGGRPPAPVAREVRAPVCSPDEIRRQLGAIQRDLDAAQRRLRTTEQSLGGSTEPR